MERFKRTRDAILKAMAEEEADAPAPPALNLHLHFHFHSRPPSAILQTASAGSEAAPPERSERSAPAAKTPLPRAGRNGWLHAAARRASEEETWTWPAQDG